jgi:hypothetical protein
MKEGAQFTLGERGSRPRDPSQDEETFGITLL